MIIPRKTQIILALLVTTVFLFQNCATIFQGTSQKIPVTSNPSGAKIIVDGEEIGYAPLILKLKKKKKSHIIRIEKPGYNPLEIKTTRKISALSLAITTVGSVLAGCGCAVLGGFIGMWVGPYSTEGFSSEGAKIGMIVGAILGGGGSILKSFESKAIYILSPKELNVTLKKIEGKPQPNLILIDAEQFQNIKWIRIKCADSDEEEIVNLD